jgi:hypothetical protein
MQEDPKAGQILAELMGAKLIYLATETISW